VQLAAHQELRPALARMYHAGVQGEVIDQLKTLRATRQDGLCATVHAYAVDPNRNKLSAPSVAGFEDSDLDSLVSQQAGSSESGDSAPDHDNFCHRPPTIEAVSSSCAARRISGPSVWTSSTIMARTAGSASGGTPWPRLKI
jgi:hypothetical protein